MKYLDTITDEYLETILPHGSGIDCDWTFDRQRNGAILCRNSYHLMDEYGYYCGYQDFTIKIFAHKTTRVHKLIGPCEGQTQVIHRIGDIDFSLQFNGYRHSLTRAIDLRDSLEQEFQYALSEANIISSM